MTADIVEVIEMRLFFINDCFKDFHAGAVAVVPAYKEILVIYINCVVLELCIEHKDAFDLLPLCNLAC